MLEIRTLLPLHTHVVTSGLVDCSRPVFILLVPARPLQIRDASHEPRTSDQWNTEGSGLRKKVHSTEIARVIEAKRALDRAVQVSDKPVVLERVPSEQGVNDVSVSLLEHFSQNSVISHLGKHMVRRRGVHVMTS